MEVDIKADWCTHRAAKYACENWHYSKCHPSTLGKAFRIGFWENEKFIGVIIFGMGANPQIGSPYGLKNIEICELTRVALKTHITPVSKMLKIALAYLKKHTALKLVVSYADTGQNHYGGIYQATNWIYEGKSKGVDRIFYNNKEYHAKGFRASFGNKKITKEMRIKGTDKHKYLMPLNKEIRKEIIKLSKPYPKK